jgi:hypothetical protein
MIFLRLSKRINDVGKRKELSLERGYDLNGFL